MSLTKIMVLGFCSLGIYELYWMYRQWRAYQESAESDHAVRVSPTGRALFAIFFVHELFRNIRTEARAVGQTRSLPRIEGASSLMSTLWIISSIVVRFVSESDRFSNAAHQVVSTARLGFFWGLLFVSLLPLLPIISAQKEINRTHLCINPTNEIERRYSTTGVLTIIVGKLFIGVTSIFSIPSVQRHFYLRNTIDSCVETSLKEGALVDAASTLCG